MVTKGEGEWGGIKQEFEMKNVIGKDLLWASLRAQVVEDPPATQQTPVRPLGREDPLEKG